MPPVSPELAAHLSAVAEHVFPILLLHGLATRFSALALLGMALVIEVLVYPDAYPTRGTWATILLYLMARGPGAVSIDHLIKNALRNSFDAIDYYSGFAPSRSRLRDSITAIFPCR